MERTQDTLPISLRNPPEAWGRLPTAVPCPCARVHMYTQTHSDTTSLPSDLELGGGSERTPRWAGAPRNARGLDKERKKKTKAQKKKKKKKNLKRSG